MIGYGYQVVIILIKKAFMEKKDFQAKITSQDLDVPQVFGMIQMIKSFIYLEEMG